MSIENTNRRDFLKNASLATVGLALPKTPQTTEIPVIARNEATTSEILRGGIKDKIRIGFIGVGMRGRNHLELVLLRADCEAVAICDVDPKALAESHGKSG
jgi:hypothetical protein